MPPITTTTFKILGPMFETPSKVSVGFAKAVNRGLLDLATIEGANKVKEQLYPGHGRITGNLRNHIGASIVRDYISQVDAGKARYGENLNYAGRVEGLYGMFQVAYDHINNNPTLYEDYIGDALVEAFD
jgi:hypothetical protein